MALDKANSGKPNLGDPSVVAELGSRLIGIVATNVGQASTGNITHEDSIKGIDAAFYGLADALAERGL
jgi:hypothetical protein